MPRADIPQDHLTDYERAVCYYTLPRIYSPVSFGLIAIYAFCLFEALCAAAYGTYAGNQDFVTWGVAAFIGLVVFGIVAFLARGLMNDIRTRRALAEARGVPDAPESNLPDPFADHVLLKHPINHQGKLFACMEDDLTIDYFVDSSPDGNWWKITDPEDNEVCRVKSLGGAGSFVFNVSLPGSMEVLVGDKRVAVITPRFSLSAPMVHIMREGAAPDFYLIQGQGIVANGQLVGRVYTLRNSLYLDIHKDHLNEATLAYFVALN